jgi:hypothetical protein
MDASPERYPAEDPRWGNDFEWVLERIREDFDYFPLASKEFRKQMRLVMAVLHNKEGGNMLPYFSPAIRNNRAVVLKALRYTPESVPPEVWNAISPELRTDSDFIRQALAIDSDVYRLLSHDHQMNREFIEAFVRNNPSAFSYLPSEAQHDRQLILSLIARYTDFILPLTGEGYDGLYSNDMEFWEQAAAVNGNIVEEFPARFQASRRLLLLAVSNDGSVLDRLRGWVNGWRAYHQYTDPPIYDIDAIEKDREVILAAATADHNPSTTFIKDDPELRLAAATADRNPNLQMLSAILHDVEMAITVSMKERLLVAETDAMKRVRMERLAGYEELLGRLAASDLERGGAFERKIEELVAMLNHPERSTEFYEYRINEAIDDIDAVGHEHGEKRKRETDAFASGAALPRLPVFV